MKLVSDFSDYYDHAFDLSGREFRRMSWAGPCKRSQLQLLQNAGYFVPPHGCVKDVLGTYWSSEGRDILSVVLYEDEWVHCAQGKRRLTTREMLAETRPQIRHQWLESYCSAFVGNPHARPAVSWRLLQIGPHRFWLEYKSVSSWMSNYGEGSCAVIGIEKNSGYHSLPLFAIDFVISKEMYAVDFNVSPGIRGSGVERILTAKEVAQAIEAFPAQENGVFQESIMQTGRRPVGVHIPEPLGSTPKSATCT